MVTCICGLVLPYACMETLIEFTDSSTRTGEIVLACALVGWPRLIGPCVFPIPLDCRQWGNPDLAPLLGLAWDCGGVTTGPVTVRVCVCLRMSDVMGVASYCPPIFYTHRSHEWLNPAWSVL